MTTDVWLTPPHILQAVGGAESFDLDPCACEDRPWPTAREHLTWRDNGLRAAWFGRVWCNPPYSNWAPWIGRLAEHRRGLGLIFARTDTEPFIAAVWDAASALFFIQARVAFRLPDGRIAGRAREPSVLCAYGPRDAEVLADCGLAGRFVPLQLPRMLAVAALDRTWREEIEAWFAGRREPVTLAEIYRAFAGRPKARRNPNYRAKIRQTLQQGRFARVGRGVWELAA